MREILVLIYANPERYPPTLNALSELAKNNFHISVLYRAESDVNWPYGRNIALIADGKTKISFEFLGKVKSAVFKIRYLFKIVINAWSIRPDIYLIYDENALRYFAFVKLLLPKGFNWFHSHDVPERRESLLTYYRKMLRPISFNKLNLVTLPSLERLKYLPLADKTKTLVLPNYPSLSFYKELLKEKVPQDEIILLYQGSINDQLGLEQFVLLLRSQINDKSLRLRLCGPDRRGYVSKLLMLAGQMGVSERVEYLGEIPYHNLPVITSSCNIGIATLKPRSLNYATAGTASNKLYEYAACALPVVYFDDLHYVDYLDRYEWAFKTDLSLTNLSSIVGYIDSHFLKLSSAARATFFTQNNFENFFKDVIEELPIKSRS